jgi:hypothetical protein
MTNREPPTLTFSYFHLPTLFTPQFDTFCLFATAALIDWYISFDVYLNLGAQWLFQSDVY